MNNPILRWLRKPLLLVIPVIKNPEKKPIATVFQGLRLAVEDSRFDVLFPRLNSIEVEWRGFAYEGVGIAFAVYDCLQPRKRHLASLISQLDDTYIISAYIGAGMALSMLQRKHPERFLARQDSLVFRWMIMNGYGFFKGFFGRKRYIERQEQVPHVSPYGSRVFDQGLGRAIWFANDRQVEQIIATLATFPDARQVDLWNGIGFTCTYAGSLRGRQDCEVLQQAAGPYRLQLAVAAALAAQRRLGSGYMPEYTDQACRIFCGLSGEDAAAIANEALKDLPTDDVDLLHMLWRERVEAVFASRGATNDGVRDVQDMQDAIK